MQRQKVDQSLSGAGEDKEWGETADGYRSLFVYFGRAKADGNVIELANSNVYTTLWLY